jgi:predicted TIM-barrel fold metal-dependent hydrolase
MTRVAAKEAAIGTPKAKKFRTLTRTWKKSRFNEYFVIDGDRHVVEPPEVFTTFLESKYKNQACVVLKDNVTGGTRFMVEGRLYQKPAGPGQGRIEGNSKYRPRGEKYGLSYEEAHRWVCGEGKLKDMDDAGIDISLWIPTGGLFIPDILDPDLQAAYARAENNWFAESFCAENPTRLWFAATIPIDVEPACREAERAVTKLGAKAIWMRPNIMQGRFWWDRSYDKLWATLQDLDVPLVFHEATGAYHTTLDASHKYSVYWLAHVISHPVEMTTALVGIIGHGVLDRFPGLRVELCEAGLSWVPYYLFRMDEHHETRGAEVELQMKPSDYFKRQVVVCSFEPEEALFAESVRWFNGKNVGATSDYPHWDSSGIDTLERYIEEFPDFTEAERQDFLQNNLCDLFGVEVKEG